MQTPPPRHQHICALIMLATWCTGSTPFFPHAFIPHHVSIQLYASVYITDKLDFSTSLASYYTVQTQ